MGFSHRGTTFFRKHDDGNTLLLSLQKSTKSLASETLVTINYGVYSARVGGRVKGSIQPAPDIWEAHWRRRLSEGKSEKWLRIESAATPEEVAGILLEAAAGVLFELEQRSSDEELRDEWLVGTSPGLTEMQRLVYLAILVSEIGPVDRLDDVWCQVRSNTHRDAIERQLAELGIRLSA
ncbi:MAG TPA: DUF4304 domain-containing protein [Candidatus Polarisedimenticolaceae bacterium]|nr:DUF4304 domain-containing protein [Candidatus Polarisedimenticolaceae bacterium]